MCYDFVLIICFGTCICAVMCPLAAYHQKHPVNLALLGLFTVVLSLTVGISCAYTKGWSFSYLLSLVKEVIKSDKWHLKFLTFVFSLSLSWCFMAKFWHIYSGRIVLEALILTAAVVFSLTGYTFWASKKGKDFSFLGPILFSSLIVIILFGFIQVMIILVIRLFLVSLFLG